MTNKSALTLIAAAVDPHVLRRPVLRQHAATGPGPGGSTTSPHGAGGSGGRWLGGDADTVWDDAGGGGRPAPRREVAPWRRLRRQGRPDGGRRRTGAGRDRVDDHRARRRRSAPPHRSGPGLRAGSVDDNAAFADYLKYRDEFRRLGITVHDVDVVRPPRRHRRRRGRPTPARRHRHGRRPDLRRSAPAPTAGPSCSATWAVPPCGWGEHPGRGRLRPAAAGSTASLSPSTVLKRRAKLDVLFLIDTTGSMGDEIDRLKDSVRSVAERISSLPANAGSLTRLPRCNRPPRSA